MLVGIVEDLDIDEKRTFATLDERANSMGSRGVC